MNYGYNFEPQRMEIIHVNGKAGAEAFRMPPNSNAILLDDTAPRVWLKMTDGGGYGNAIPYKIVPEEPEKPIDLAAIMQRLEKLEETLNAKSDVIETEQSNN